MSAPASRALRTRDLLAQVELLVLFHPSMQSGGASPVKAMPANCTQGWLTVDVHGVIAKSELTGLPCLEDMRLEVDGEDIEEKLPPSVVEAIADYVLDN